MTTKTIKVDAKTQYFCIKRTVINSIKHFIENKLSNTLMIEMSWRDINNNILSKRTVIAFRDDVYRFVDVDNITLNEFNKMKLHKKHYLQVWNEMTK